MAPPLVTYHKDEKVLCFHHEILYEAKILDIRHTDPEDKKSPFEYAVHYKGWKSTYVTLCILPTFRPFHVIRILPWIPFMERFKRLEPAPGILFTLIPCTPSSGNSWRCIW